MYLMRVKNQFYYMRMAEKGLNAVFSSVFSPLKPLQNPERVDAACSDGS